MPKLLERPQVETPVPVTPREPPLPPLLRAPGRFARYVGWALALAIVVAIIGAIWWAVAGGELELTGEPWVSEERGIAAVVAELPSETPWTPAARDLPVPATGPWSADARGIPVTVTDQPWSVADRGLTGFSGGAPWTPDVRGLN